MANIFETACRIAAEEMGIGAILRREWVKSVSKDLAKGSGKKLLPSPNESVAIAWDTPKTSALAFDRVLRIPWAEEIPEEAGYYCATLSELVPQAGTLLSKICDELHIETKLMKDASPQQRDENKFRRFQAIAAYQAKHSQVFPTVVYTSTYNREVDLTPGAREVFAASLTELDIVREDHLSWEQILEFRRDAEARVKYRRLMRWLDLELKEGSPREVVDLISERLDDYRWSLRKHGVETVAGSISTVFDPKFLSAASASAGGAVLAFGAVWGGLAAAGIALTKVGAEFAKMSIGAEEDRRSKNYEIAYVHEIKSKLNS